MDKATVVRNPAKRISDNHNIPQRHMFLELKHQFPKLRDADITNCIERFGLKKNQCEKVLERKMKENARGHYSHWSQSITKSSTGRISPMSPSSSPSPPVKETADSSDPQHTEAPVYPKHIYPPEYIEKIDHIQTLPNSVPTKMSVKPIPGFRRRSADSAEVTCRQDTSNVHGLIERKEAEIQTTGTSDFKISTNQYPTNTTSCPPTTTQAFSTNTCTSSCACDAKTCDPLTRGTRPSSTINIQVRQPPGESQACINIQSHGGSLMCTVPPCITPSSQSFQISMGECGNLYTNLHSHATNATIHIQPDDANLVCDQSKRNPVSKGCPMVVEPYCDESTLCASTRNASVSDGMGISSDAFTSIRSNIPPRPQVPEWMGQPNYTDEILQEQLTRKELLEQELKRRLQEKSKLEEQVQKLKDELLNNERSQEQFLRSKKEYILSLRNQNVALQAECEKMDQEIFENEHDDLTHSDKLFQPAMSNDSPFNQLRPSQNLHFQGQNIGSKLSQTGSTFNIPMRPTPTGASSSIPKTRSSEAPQRSRVVQNEEIETIWSCSRCTFNNNALLSECEICSFPKFPTTGTVAASGPCYCQHRHRDHLGPQCTARQ